jgi:hypothetical protein
LKACLEEFIEELEGFDGLSPNENNEEFPSC